MSHKSSRKPIDKQQPTECRQAIWAFIRSRIAQGFTIDDVRMAVDLEEQSIREYITGLCVAGYLKTGLEQTGLTKTPNYRYHLVNDCGHDAPRVRMDGTEVTQGQGRQQLWNTMRILKEFNATDLAFNASTDDHQVDVRETKNYIGLLLKANYLRLLSPSKSGHKPGTGTEARYMLIPTMWTGPHPPQVQRTKQIYDPNLQRVVWAKIEGGAE